MMLLLCIVLTGCATTGHLSTPSGRPEVFVENVTNKEVINKCVGLIVANGWQTEQVTDYMVQAVMRSNNVAADFLLGTQLGGYQTWYRIIINFVQEPSGVRVYAMQKIVSNKGTGCEQVLDLTNQQAYQNTQGILDRLELETKGAYNSPVLNREDKNSLKSWLTEQGVKQN